MEIWENYLVVAAILFVTAPITTLVSMAVKWLWEHPYITARFLHYNDGQKDILDIDFSVRRYSLNKLEFIGKYANNEIELNEKLNNKLSQKEKIDLLDELKSGYYRFSYGKSKIYIPIKKNKIHKFPWRIKKLIGLWNP